MWPVPGWIVTVLLTASVAAVPSPASLKADIKLLFLNDLLGASSPAANSGAILLSGRDFTLREADVACAALGERLWAPERANEYSLNGTVEGQARFWIGPAPDDRPRTMDAAGRIATVAEDNMRLPALCTQSAPFSNATSADNSVQWRVSVRANGEELVGYRDRRSFRFLGVRYAPHPGRFNYSAPYRGSGGKVQAIEYGSPCLQLDNSGAEDCLFLNIWTPFLPRNSCAAKPRKLKPVMFWIHGGAFTGGSGSDTLFDGGNIVSRGDVVQVTINYRLGTLGFLALKDGVTNGNYGLADQILALDWVRDNIRNFGGDPDRITIFGQSAGAASVRALMASPRAVGKFAGAIPMSNLGGLNYGTTYSRYYTISQEYDVAAKQILDATNCTDAASQVDCLRKVPATQFNTVSAARYLVVDGKYLTSNQLDVSPGPALPFHLMMGIVAEDGAPFIDFPRTSNETAYLASIGFAPPSPRLFPVPDGTANATLALYNMSSRLATDGEFRCVDQATVAGGLRGGRLGSRVFYYEFDRTYQTAGWPRLDVCEPPKTAAFPNGDPSRPYLRCHSGELMYVFGNLEREGRPLRDHVDLPFMQFVLDSFASFARTYDPNPDEAFLVARGYKSTLQQQRQAGPWWPATAASLTMRVLDWPPYQGPFRDLAQCESLGMGLNYYQ